MSQRDEDSSIWLKVGNAASEVVLISREMLLSTRWPISSTLFQPSGLSFHPADWLQLIGYTAVAAKSGGHKNPEIQVGNNRADA